MFKEDSFGSKGRKYCMAMFGSLVFMAGSRSNWGRQKFEWFYVYFSVAEIVQKGLDYLILDTFFTFKILFELKMMDQ